MTMTYSTHTTVRRDNAALTVILLFAYAVVLGAIAYALPITSLLKDVTR